MRYLHSVYSLCCQHYRDFSVCFSFCLYLLVDITFCLLVACLLNVHLRDSWQSGNILVFPGFFGAGFLWLVWAVWPIFAAVGACHLLVSCASRGVIGPFCYIGVEGGGGTLAVSTVKLHPPETLGGAAFFDGIPVPLLFSPNYLGDPVHLATPSDER